MHALGGGQIVSNGEEQGKPDKFIEPKQHQQLQRPHEKI